MRRGLVAFADLESESRKRDAYIQMVMEVGDMLGGDWLGTAKLAGRNHEIGDLRMAAW